MPNGAPSFRHGELLLLLLLFLLLLLLLLQTPHNPTLLFARPLFVSAIVVCLFCLSRSVNELRNKW